MDLQKVDEAMRRLPVRPFAALQLMRMVDDPEVSLSDLAEIVEMDPVSSSRVIRLANSAAHGGAGRPVISAERAVTLLGSSTVKAVVAAGAFPLLNDDVDLGPADYWVHAVGVGAAASVAAEFVDVSARDAYTAGILHDFGRAVLHEIDPDGVRAVADAPVSGLLSGERKHFGVDHAALGADLAARWGFPPPLVEAIRDHHCPAEGVGPLTRAVILGEAIAASLETVPSSEPVQPLQELLAALHIFAKPTLLQDRTMRKYERAERVVVAVR